MFAEKVGRVKDIRYLFIYLLHTLSIHLFYKLDISVNLILTK